MIFNTASDFASTTCCITINLKASCTCIFIGYLIKPSPLLLSKWDAEGKKRKSRLLPRKEFEKGVFQPQILILDATKDQQVEDLVLMYYFFLIFINFETST